MGEGFLWLDDISVIVSGQGRGLRKGNGKHKSYLKDLGGPSGTSEGENSPATLMKRGKKHSRLQMNPAA